MGPRCAALAGLRLGVDHQAQARIIGGLETRVNQAKQAFGWMPKDLDAGSGPAHFVALPPARKFGTAFAKPPEEVGERWIARPKVVTATKLGHHALGLIGPCRTKELARRRMRKQMDENVSILFDQAPETEQPVRGSVPSQDIPTTPEHVGRLTEVAHQALEILGHRLADERASHRIVSERAQVSVLDLAEAKRPGERVDGGDRRLYASALLEPDVPIDADAGQSCDLLTTQAGRATPASDGKANRLRTEPFTPRAQKIAEFVVHFSGCDRSGGWHREY